MKHTVSLFGVLALVGVLMLPSHAVLADETKTNTTTTAAPSVIGNVTYLLGQADMTLRDGTIMPITPQTDILDGSTVSVKDRSKLNLKMVDGEIAKMPANSALRFTTYQYNPANPAASKVSKEIIKGDVTTKTGEAGHYAPTRYRLNSPLAAIAVLGTEYTVQVRADETRVTVIAGKISMAKLGGACMRSGFGECAGGERLSESQRGLALVVLKDQPRPVLIPAAAAAPAPSQVQAAPAAEPSKADEKTADKSADQSTDKKADKQEVAAAPATTDDKSVASVTAKASDKATETVTEKVIASTSDKKAVDNVANTSAKTTESTKTVDERDSLAELVSTPKTVTSNASTPSATTTTTTLTKVDERDPFAEPVVVEVKKTTPTPVVAVVAPIETNTKAATPVVTQVAVNTAPSSTSTAPASSLESTSSTAFVVASPTTTTSTTPTVPVSSTSTPATIVTTPSNSLTLVSSSGSGSTVLGTSSSSLSGSALSTAPLGTSIGTSLGGTSNELLESNKSTTTVTTDAGEVIPTVTPPPVVVPPPVVTPPVDNTLPVVRWDKFNPATPVGDSTTLGDQVSSQYEQLIAGTAAGDFIIERQKGASPTLAEQGGVSLALGSYEANVRNAGTGEQVAATIGNATLTVNSAQQTFGTGFTLNSSLYNGAVKATGTYSATDGILTDDRTNPQTTIHGAVGSLGDSSGAAYTFTHQIDTQLSANGGLNWTGTVVAPVVGATVGN